MLWQDSPKASTRQAERSIESSGYVLSGLCKPDRVSAVRLRHPACQAIVSFVYKNGNRGIATASLTLEVIAG
ncbi:hypothetical protein RRG08_008572 [Elysia crispata]|uniref:Uncharacterized protein n=1 Tax=Elysia crispata TaxID=231223 RepID=A0AAE0Y117_9GAST|nr:hypothetical protein RRG08_008572 [Elysia crispata]